MSKGIEYLEAIAGVAALRHAVASSDKILGRRTCDAFIILEFLIEKLYCVPLEIVRRNISEAQYGQLPKCITDHLFMRDIRNPNYCAWPGCEAHVIYHRRKEDAQ